ncbi:uncharacterized protein LOC119658273 [Hermetia illucens]|uniref:uncharacterized protein LOC119658273 n=1 Tax=Hermetia illucens TaxID=343691 RepID=UPI0018CC0079|nr:uncharacterized protein LOC119658273 [Hermetia illucens]
MRYLLFISVRLGHHTRKTLLKLEKCRNYAFRDENLYFVNVIGSTIISALGDFLCQSSARALNSKIEYDTRRTARMAISDGYFGGTFSHFAYEGFDIYWPERSLRSTIKKLAADQIIVAPIGLLIFQVAVGYMSAESFEEIVQNIKDSMLSLYKISNDVCTCIFYTRSRVFFKDDVRNPLEVKTSLNWC